MSKRQSFSLDFICVKTLWKFIYSHIIVQINLVCSWNMSFLNWYITYYTKSSIYQNIKSNIYEKNTYLLVESRIRQSRPIERRAYYYLLTREKLFDVFLWVWPTLCSGGIVEPTIWKSRGIFHYSHIFILPFAFTISQTVLVTVPPWWHRNTVWIMIYGMSTSLLYM